MRGSVFKRGGRFTVKFELPADPVTGKRRQKWISGFDRKADAEKALVKLLRELDDGSYVEPSRATVGVYLTEWLDSLRNVRATTHDSYSRWVKGQVIPRIGHVPLQAVDGAVLNALYSELLASGRKDGKGGLSTRTVSYVHTILHRAFKDAVRWKRLQVNPADAADPPKVSASARKQIGVWDAATVAAFLKRAREADERSYAAWVVLATTGARRGEVLGLRWSDIDLTQGRMAIRRSWTVVRHEPLFQDTKTSAGTRSVALDDETVAVLRSWKAQQAQERLLMGAGWQDVDGQVFTMPNGSMVHPESFSKVFDRRVAAWKLPHLTIHGLRHTWATVALTSGVHPRVVQERLGHATIAVTLQTYSHVTPSLHDDAAREVASQMLR